QLRDYYDGVGGVVFNSRGEPLVPLLRVAKREHIAILEPASSDLFSAPIADSYALQPFSMEPPSLHRQRLQGTVTLWRPGEYFYLATPWRSFRIHTRESRKLHVGDVVEASGFVRHGKHFAVMSEAVTRKVGSVEPPEPIAVTHSEILSVGYLPASQLQLEDYDGRLVQMSGKLLKLETSDDIVARLHVESGGKLLTASLRSGEELFPPRGLRPGSILALTGICVLELDYEWATPRSLKPTAVSLLLRNGDDIDVISEPSPWTPEQQLRLLAGVAIFLVMALAWVVALKRRVAVQTRLIHAKVERESVLEERQRIGRQLHDTVQQELTGIGMLVSSAEMELDAHPEKARVALDLAGRMVQRCSEESRASIEDLHSVMLERVGLREAIEEQVRPLAELNGATFSMTVSGTERRLRARIETILLRIAHEAAANAGKHAQAKAIDLTLHYEPSEVQLTVRDDGSGFDRSQLPTDPSSFGLLIMEERALKLNGRFSIESTLGEGTTVRTVLPLPPS
ncbi:MAG: sensor histidine kinase, partial [Verrucomicrobiota bacterium]